MTKSFRNLFLLLAQCSVMVTALTGCEQKTTEPGGDVPEVQGDYRRGVWEETTYKNDYLGLTFPLPEGYKIVGEREILRLMSLDRRQFENKEEQDKEVAKKTLIFDFVIGDETTDSGMPMVQLMAENLKASGEEELSALDYAKKLSEQLLTQENNPNGYVIDVPADHSFAGGDWTILTTVMEKKELAQWYLVQRQGDYIISFVCTFPPDRQADIENFLQSVEAL